MTVRIKETNFEFDPNLNRIIYDGEWFFPVDKVSPRRPLITGNPSITYDKHRIFLTRNKILRKYIYRVLNTPKDCSWYHIINYPVRLWGSPQVAFIGAYGYAKSRHIGLTQANWIPRKHRIFQFDDAEMEAQLLLHHGFFQKDMTGELQFKPFDITIWIPKGYEFDTKAENFNLIKSNHVHLKEFSNVKEIVDNFKPYKFNSIFREAFTDESALLLLLDIIKIVRKQASKHKSYVFSRHELGDMLPESASGKMYDLVRDTAIQQIRKFRKYRIGILSSYHASYDVTYTVDNKFGIIGQVRPIRHKNMTLIEMEAQNYKRGDVAISNGGFFRKHHINEFPVHNEEYIYSPNDVPWMYPEFCPANDEMLEGGLPKSVKEVTKVYVQWLAGESARQTARSLGFTKYSVTQMFKEFEKEIDIGKISRG